MMILINDWCNTLLLFFCCCCVFLWLCWVQPPELLVIFAGPKSVYLEFWAVLSWNLYLAILFVPLWVQKDKLLFCIVRFLITRPRYWVVYSFTQVRLSDPSDPRSFSWKLAHRSHHRRNWFLHLLWSWETDGWRSWSCLFWEQRLSPWLIAQPSWFFHDYRSISEVLAYAPPFYSFYLRRIRGH